VTAVDGSTTRLFSGAGVLPRFPEELPEEKRKCTFQHFTSQLNQLGISSDPGVSVNSQCTAVSQGHW